MCIGSIQMLKCSNAQKEEKPYFMFQRETKIRSIIVSIFILHSTSNYARPIVV